MSVIETLTEWPYKQVEHERACFMGEHGRNPSKLLVGSALWATLCHSAPSADWFVTMQMPIEMDRMHILEPHEFLCCY